MKKEKKKIRASTIILILILLVGLSLLLYPTVSNVWNSLHQSRAVASYVKDVENLDDTDYDQIWKNAVDYNKRLADSPQKQQLTDAEKADYETQLLTGQTDVIGYVEIPTIGCKLPIYHGTDEGVLQVAIGHLEWTSLPVGGKGTHCVISGHRGLPSAKLFTNLDQMVEGDIFQLHVLKETLTYEVDQILVVEPKDLGALQIEEGKDYCTLMTCTPYGVNSHRLLVRGHRIENPKELPPTAVTAVTVFSEPLLFIPMILIPILFVVLLWLLRKPKKKETSHGGDHEND